MIKDLFTKKVLAVVCAATLSVGSIAVAYATSDFGLAGAAASASASASATAKPEEPTTENPTKPEPTSKPEEPTTEDPTKPTEPTTKPEPTAAPTTAPSAEPSEEPTNPTEEDTYQILGTLVGTWNMGEGTFMTQSKDDANVYTATIPGVAAGKYEYQIVKNGSWQSKFSGSQGFADSDYPNLICNVKETCDVVVTLNLKDMTVKTSVDEETPVQKDMSAATVTLKKAKTTYNGTTQNPEVASVVLGTDTLVAGTDYEVEAVTAKKAGTYTVKVNGIGNYKGTATAEYTISKRDIAKATATVKAKTYTGKKLTSSSYTVKMKLNGKPTTLKKGTDYTVKAASRTSVGSSTVTITGKGNFKGTLKAKFAVTAKKISATKVTVSSKVAYTGKTVKAKVIVKDGSKKLDSKSYKVSYKNNKKIGKATVTITGKGNYAGTIKKTFKIVPAKASIKTVKNSAKKTATVKFKTVKGAKAYKVAYKVKGAKKWSTVTTKKTTAKLAKLKKGKTYQVKVAAYTKVGKTTYIGSYSAAKTVKIKK